MAKLNVSLFLKDREAKGLIRKIRRETDSPQGSVNFGHNDYLGLAQSSDVVKSAQSALRTYGVGSTGSRLLSGSSTTADSLENAIALSKGFDRALLFSSGYQANVTLLPAILSTNFFQIEPVVFLDKKSHASLYTGVRASGVPMHRFAHNNLDMLESLLEKHGQNRQPVIITETLFSVDGDKVDRSRLRKLVDHYRAFVYLDEAHGVGMDGRHGWGVQQSEFKEGTIIAVGSLAKAIGCLGAFSVCRSDIREYIVNTCEGLMFSTAPPPALMQAAETAWHKVREMDAVRKQIIGNAQRAREAFREAGFNTGSSTEHIIPLFFTSIEEGLAVKKSLESEGILAALLRAPSVPTGGSCVRVSITALHDEGAIDRLINWALSR